jgi:Ca-activated chloride channel family protein
MRRILLALAPLVPRRASLLTPSPASACWIHVQPQPRIQPVHLVEDHVEVAVRDQVAVFTVRPTFHNPNPVQIEGTYYMELEPGADVSRFSMTVNGREISAELLDSAKARQIYQGIVSQMRDPALLEYYGAQLLQARIFPIPANGDIRITVQYTQQLENNGGLVRLNALNTSPKALLQPLRQTSFRAVIESSTPITSVVSPTHPIEVVRSGDRSVRVAYEQNRYLPKSGLTLYYGLAPDPVGIHALTGADDAGRAYAMLLCAPRVEWSDGDRLPKDVVFVFDTSGSMAGEKMTQAKGALAHCLNRLDPRDRFNIVDFSTEARVFSETLVDASPGQVKSALKYVDRMEARGGTAIAEALERGMGLFRVPGQQSPVHSPHAPSIELLPRDRGPGTGDLGSGTLDRLPLLVFMTDGLPTVGDRNPDAILNAVQSRNAGRIRLFTFGVGYDVNTRLLDGLAAANGGARDYVAPSEDIEVRVSSFFDKVAAPVLTDVTVAVDGARFFDVYPRRMPDLFRGGQVALFGRIEGGGVRDVVLTGRSGAGMKTFRARVDFSDPALRHDLVPRLWATRKVAFLLEDLRLHGGTGPAYGSAPVGATSGRDRDEVVHEIVALARQYGIVTPYTSYLITEDTAPGGRPMPVASSPAQEAEWLRRETAGKAAEGQKAVGESKAMKQLGAESAPSAPPPSAGAAADVAEQVAQEKGYGDSDLQRRLRNIGSKTFYAAGDVWYDSLFREGDEKKARAVKFMSAEYLKLLDEKPALAKFLSLGREIYVQFEGTWYHVVPE